MDRLGGTFGSHDHADEYEDYDDSDHGDDLGAPQSPVGQDERRMQVRAYNHWASLLGDRNFPAIGELNPAGLDDFGPYSVLLDFSSGIEDPGILFLGRELAGECGALGRISRLSDVPSRSLLSRITDHYMQILANQAPIGFEAEFLNQRSQTVLYRGILLPYSSNDETIDFIYGVINWKELADRATADELLLEIDQALERDTSAEGQWDDTPEETEVLDLAGDWMDEEEEDILDLGALPAEPAGETLSDEIDWDAADSPLCRRRDNESFGSEGKDEDEDEPDYSVDYGERGLEDELEGEDVDDVVDPLADESVGQGLAALVSRGHKRKPLVELPSAEDIVTAAAIPQAYEPDESSQPFVSATIVAPEHIEESPVDAQAVEDESAFEEPAAVEHREADEIDSGESAATEANPFDVIEDVASANEAGDFLPAEESSIDVPPDSAHPEAAPVEGLYDMLAEARELAQVARSSEDRTRHALYQAVGRAYDFSLEAGENPEQFAELVADSGLSVQERAPMTPVVKLVFGSDYDKTRVTEYAAVLQHAHRIGVARGGLADLLKRAEGGLRGLVEAERRARKEEAGKPIEEIEGVRPALAKKLRKLAPLDLADLAGDGPEFALVMVRRDENGELVVLGEVPEEIALVERAARKLVG